MLVDERHLPVEARVTDIADSLRIPRMAPNSTRSPDARHLAGAGDVLQPIGSGLATRR